MDQVRLDILSGLKWLFGNILKVSGQYLHLLPSYKGAKINLLRGRVEQRERERAESREQRAERGQ